MVDAGTGIDNSGLFNPTGLSSGTYVIEYTYQDSNSCEGSDQINITIVDKPLVNIIETDFSLCVDANPVLLTTNLSGGTWSGTGIDNSGLFNPTGLSSGTYTLTYTYQDSNSCEASDQINITIVDKPVVNIIESDFSLCIDANPVLLTTNLSGGTWSGTGIDNSGLFNPTGLSAGTYTLTYTYQDSNSCEGSDQINITIVDKPVVNIIETDFSLCIDANPILLTTNLSGGTWSGTGIDNSGLFNPTGLSSGTYTLTYTYQDSNSCEGSDQINITIVDKPIVNIIETDFSLCIDANPVLLTTNLSGGTWSGTGIDNSGLFNPTGLSSGTYVITYTYQDSNSCEDSDQINITIVDKPVVNIIESDFSLCVDASPVLLTTNLSGGTWSGTGIDNSGLFNPTGLSSGTYTLTYTYQDSNSCEGSDQINITIVDKPVVNIIETDFSLCVDASPVVLSTNVSGGTWSGTGTDNSGLFNPTGLSAGTYTLTYTYQDSNSCEGSDQINITIVDKPLVNIIESDFSLCIDANPMVLSTNVSGGTWSGTGIDNSGLFNPTGLSSGTYTLTYTYQDSNSCEGSDQINITIVDKPVVNIIESDFSLCIDANPILLSTNVREALGQEQV